MRGNRRGIGSRGGGAVGTSAAAATTTTTSGDVTMSGEGQASELPKGNKSQDDFRALLNKK